MEKVELTPARLAVFLVTQGCMPHIFKPEAMTRQVPIEGHTLTADERRLVGLTTPGLTVGYRVGDTDIFFDMAGDNATVWFAGGDFDIAGPLLRASLNMSFNPGEVVDRVRPSKESPTRTVEFEIRPAGSSRAALVSMTVGKGNAEGDARMFFCRIYPQDVLAS